MIEDLPQAVTLIGHMGSGKSALGHALTELHGIPFVDSDREIEARAGCSISEIFEKQGEEAFRQLEFEVLTDLLKEPGQVIATGGGAFAQTATRDLLLENSLTVWLNTDFELLSKRLENRRDHRPLLSGDDWQEKLRELMEQRDPLYEQAAIHVVCAEEPVHITVQRVLHAIADHQSAMDE